jgi:hypothetical protein
MVKTIKVQGGTPRQGIKKGGQILIKTKEGGQI